MAKKKFTKKDLETGDIVQTRDGDLGVVIVEKDRVYFKNGSFLRISSWASTLDGRHGATNDDVMRVYRDACSFMDCGYEGTTVVYDRERDTVVEMTLEQVCKALGKNVKIVKGE